MTSATAIDAARVELLLSVRLPAIKAAWPAWRRKPTRKAGPPPASWRRSPSTR